MKKNYLTIVALIFLILLSCEKKQAINTNAFQNRWESMYGNLTIYSNNTFEYNRYTCISHSISKGKWKITNDTLVLNSFEPKGCYFIENFLFGPPYKDSSTNHKKTIKDCMPNTGYINFKNEKFYIKDSLLLFKTPFNNKELNNFYNFKRAPYKKQTVNNTKL
ncbi:hypothetical protein [Flavobacterium aquicola]|uniref:Lipocalin-like protein n=1 Tax=Flavobacterium aquicola TaxID=1682742 RepID=A0A3E0DVV7_9FLAO|nr:hypothetical protein [Flavobacterium aquicola]REG88767.1 hypothetical protein C8P67_1287 [Flavobacterium aquicola]